MQNRMTTIPTMIGAIAILIAGSIPAHAQKGGSKPPPPTYSYAYTNLGARGFSNFYGRKAYNLNQPDSAGVLDIVAWDQNGSSIWEATSSGTVLSRVDSTVDQAAAVNDAGWKVIQSGSKLFVDVPNVGRVELPDSGFSLTNYALLAADINNAGQVVATDHVAVGGAIRGMWTVAADGTVSNLVDLGTFSPMSINDFGEMAGYVLAGSPQSPMAAVAWFENGQLQVQTLPGLYANGYGVATAINNVGEVVGYSTSSTSWGGTYRPFLWSTDRGLVALASEGAAADINDLGQVVGYAWNGSSRYAFLWKNGTLSDLNALSGVGTKSFRLATAEAINHAGHIVGRSETYKGTQLGGTASFLLTPK